MVLIKRKPKNWITISFIKQADKTRELLTLKVSQKILKPTLTSTEIIRSFGELTTSLILRVSIIEMPLNFGTIIIQIIQMAVLISNKTKPMGSLLFKQMISR